MNPWAVFAKCLYETLRIISWSRVEIIDEGGLPDFDRTTGVLVAANHQSHADTAVIFNTVPHSIRGRLRIVASKVRFRPADLTATRRERCERWFMHGLAVNAYRAILVGGDVGPLRSIDGITEILNDGAIVVLYPEGTRSRDGTLGILRPGVAVTAIATRCSVIPVRIDGTREALPRSHHLLRWRNRVTIRFRPAIIALEGEGADAFLVRLTEQLQPHATRNEAVSP